MMDSDHIDHVRFVALLHERFPDVAAQIDDSERGLLHLEMGCLARATQAFIESGDLKSVRAHFLFVDMMLQRASSEVENAIYVSYLENLNFGGRNSARKEAIELLTPRLKEALQELEDYLDRLFRK